MTTVVRRPFNKFTKEEGMAVAATSQESEDFRETFFVAMGEVAIERELFSTNNVWALLESRGFTRAANKTFNAAGTVGTSGCKLKLWVKTGDKVDNLSGNLHSSDNSVVVYRSLIMGVPLIEVEPKIREAARASEAKRKKTKKKAERHCATCQCE